MVYIMIKPKKKWLEKDTNGIGAIGALIILAIIGVSLWYSYNNIPEVRDFIDDILDKTVYAPGEVEINWIQVKAGEELPAGDVYQITTDLNSGDNIPIPPMDIIFFKVQFSKYTGITKDIDRFGRPYIQLQESPDNITWKPVIQKGADLGFGAGLMAGGTLTEYIGLFVSLGSGGTNSLTDTNIDLGYNFYRATINRGDGSVLGMTYTFLLVGV